MFIVALFVTVKRWKRPKCISADEWITKCGDRVCVCMCVYIRDYLNIKRDGTLIHATT